ncbi:MAG: xylulokinase [Oscillospiraceae bacterium]|nr:xylulokinase [Oscillospiraceae bacterium]
MHYIIGIDIGTSGTKTVLFNEAGVPQASATVEYPMYQPQNGWAEQDPAHWWDATVSSLRTVIREANIPAHEIAGIGLSGQMHGLVMLDKDGEVLRNSIIWCDGRTTKQCDEITARVGAKRLMELTANPALPGFTASKILWVREHEPEVYAKCCHILLPKDYIRYKLTGVCATEVSDASGMNLMDVPGRCWSDEILSVLDIDRALLADMYESYQVTGKVTDHVAALTGLTAGTPVVGGAGDNAAASVGTGVVETGRAFTTIGTSGVIFAHTDRASIDPQGRVHTFCAAVPDAWTVMSCTLSAGGSLQWFRNNFAGAEMATAKEMGIDPYELMTKQAEQVPIGANRLLFLPYLMGERSPLLNADARGVFFGLSGMHTRRDMLRAVMEGVVYSQRDCLDVLRGMGVTFTEMLATGGGGKSPLWRQMLADNYNCPVVTEQVGEGPALGVAILAGVGTGLYESVPAACKKLLRFNEAQQPIAENTAAYTPYYALYKEVYLALKSQFTTLAQL